MTATALWTDLVRWDVHLGSTASTGNPEERLWTVDDGAFMLYRHCQMLYLPDRLPLDL